MEHVTFRKKVKISQSKSWIITDLQKQLNVYHSSTSSETNSEACHKVHTNYFLNILAADRHVILCDGHIAYRHFIIARGITSNDRRLNITQIYWISLIRRYKFDHRLTLWHKVTDVLWWKICVDVNLLIFTQSTVKSYCMQNNTNLNCND